MQIYPSILSSGMEQAQAQLSVVREAGGLLQWDIVDGEFADNHTLEPQDLNASEFAGIQVDLHLMVVDPSQWLGAYLELPYIRGVIAQVERLPDPQEFLDAVQSRGWKCGFSFDVFTPVDEFPSELLVQADMIQLMGVSAGHQGQPFNPRVIEKISQLKERIKEKPQVEVIVDGGVKLELLPNLAAAGAKGVVVGSAIWQAKSPLETLKEFHRAGEAL